MKNFNFLIISLFVLIISCAKNNQEDVTAFAGATVLGKGTDCGNSFLLKFDDDVMGLPENFDHTFYEINLPEDYKIEGKKINKGWIQKPKSRRNDDLHDHGNRLSAGIYNKSAMIKRLKL